MKFESYFKVWETGKGKLQNTASVRVSESFKKDNGEYITTFSGYVTFTGDAFKKLNEAKGKADFIKATGHITNKYDFEKGKTYYNVFVDDYEEIGKKKDPSIWE